MEQIYNTFIMVIIHIDSTSYRQIKMLRLLLPLIVISTCYSYTPAETESNLLNVATKDELYKIMIEMSNEIKQLRLQQNEFMQMRKELLWTQKELQSIKHKQWMTKHVMGELFIIKHDQVKTNEKLQVLEKEQEVAKDIQTKLLITQKEQTLILHKLEVRNTTSVKQIGKVIKSVKHKDGFPNVSTYKVDHEYSDDTHSNETVQAKTIITEYPGSKMNSTGVKRSPVLPNVAFTATISSTVSGFNYRGQTLVFDNVQLNIGDGYSKQSGIFRAPVAGLYIILMTISTDYSSGPDVVLVRNGSRLCATIASIVDHSYAGSPCNVIVHLMQGDEVWAQVYSGRDTDKVRDGMWSTFSVALLFMDGSPSS